MHVEEGVAITFNARWATNASQARTSEQRCIASNKFQLAVAAMLTWSS